MNINVNIEELIRITERLIMYKKNDEFNFSIIKEKLNEIQTYYKGECIGTIQGINKIILDNFKQIDANHQYDIDYITNNIQAYEEAEILAKDIFERIGN